MTKLTAYDLATVLNPEELTWRERFLRRKVLVGRRRSPEAWNDLYAAYLQSSEWRTKKAAVMVRDQSLCQGCRSARATQIHHLSYDHVGDELLWELVAICGDCHDRCHDWKLLER